jgi:hypothetical protein
VLLAAEGAPVRVNGLPLLVGVRVLQDRDEIRVGRADSLFFSTESAARVESFSGTGASVMCPRCKQAIAEASEVVRCPGCGVVHHQAKDLPCWSGYEAEPFATCAMCDQPAALDSGFRWTPEEL